MLTGCDSKDIATGSHFHSVLGVDPFSTLICATFLWHMWGLSHLEDLIYDKFGLISNESSSTKQSKTTNPCWKHFHVNMGHKFFATEHSLNVFSQCDLKWVEVEKNLVVAITDSLLRAEGFMAHLMENKYNICQTLLFSLDLFQFNVEEVINKAKNICWVNSLDSKI